MNIAVGYKISHRNTTKFNSDINNGNSQLLLAIRVKDLIAAEKALRNGANNYEMVIRDLIVEGPSSGLFLISLLEILTRLFIKLSPESIRDVLQFGLENDLTIVEFLITN